jgi:hypothetical protein
MARLGRGRIVRGVRCRGLAGSADLASEWAGLPMLIFTPWFIATSVVLIRRARPATTVATLADGPISPASSTGRQKDLRVQHRPDEARQVPTGASSRSCAPLQAGAGTTAGAGAGLSCHCSPPFTKTQGRQPPAPRTPGGRLETQARRLGKRVGLTALAGSNPHPPRA